MCKMPESQENQSKCWGSNSYGQLGQGHSSDIGDEPGELGDNLAMIDWGSGFAVHQIACGRHHTCVIDLNSNRITCCGRNGMYLILPIFNKLTDVKHFLAF